MCCLSCLFYLCLSIMSTSYIHYALVVLRCVPIPIGELELAVPPSLHLIYHCFCKCRYFESLLAFVLYWIFNCIIFLITLFLFYFRLTSYVNCLAPEEACTYAKHVKQWANYIEEYHHPLSNHHFGYLTNMRLWSYIVCLLLCIFLEAPYQYIKG